MTDSDVKATRFDRLYVFCMSNKMVLVDAVARDGGSFAKALAQAIVYADSVNLAKILFNWSDLLWPYYDRLSDAEKHGLVEG